MAATTTLLGLVTPTQGTLSGTWGDTVNYGISDYVDIAIAGTLSFAGDGAITLANTTGSSSGNGITSTTAQYMVIRITGTQTVTKVITGPSYSKLYMVDHAGATSAVTFKASGQTGVSVAVGEKCFVYYNGTDYVKIATSTGTGSVTSVAATVPSIFSIAGSPITTSGTLAMTYSGTALPIANGGTGTTSTTFANLTTNVTGTLPVVNGGTGLTAGTSGGILAYTATGTLASSAALAANNVVVGGGAGAAPSSTNLLAISAAVTTGNYIKAIGYADTVTALGNTGTAINLDVTSGGVFTATLNGNATITLRYPVAAGASSFILILTNDATAGRTVAFSGGTFKYPGGSVTRTTTANAIDIWFFFTPDGGTTYYASIPMANLS
jgi:hypothetical protein